jgi:hypothetical protein
MRGVNGGLPATVCGGSTPASEVKRFLLCNACVNSVAPGDIQRYLRGICKRHVASEQPERREHADREGGQEEHFLTYIPDGVVTLELVDNKERNPNLDRQ